MITLLTILTTVACTIFAGGIFILYRYTERNRSQMVLMATLAVWLFIVSNGIYRVAFTDEFATLQMSILDIKVLTRAVVSYLALILYLVITIEAKLLSVRRVVLMAMPAIFIVAIYFVWHALSGIPYDIAYRSYDDLFDNIWSATVILRLLITATIVVYMSLACRFVWTLIPIYQRYVWDNYSDSRYNLLWIKKSAIALICMSLAYLINLATHCSYSLALYIFVGIFAFVLIVDNAMDRKMFIPPNKLNIRWTGFDGWQVQELDSHHIDDGDSGLIAESFDEFQQWLMDMKPYSATDFSLLNVEEQFTYAKSQLILRGIHQKGYNFQSYIRKCRIEDAVKLLSADRSLSFKQVSSIVGFSHDSSFSRAFTAVMGVTPTDFRSRG